MFPCHRRAKRQEFLLHEWSHWALLQETVIFPSFLARSARQLGAGPIVAAAFDGETSPEIDKLADHVDWIKLGQLNKLIQVFSSRGVKRAVMAGGVTPSNLFKKLRLDLRMTAVALRLKARNAETIFGAIASKWPGMASNSSTRGRFLGDSVPQAGALTRLRPSRSSRRMSSLG
jgi:UDP-2,3-diacylglucosamine hydrolase